MGHIDRVVYNTSGPIDRLRLGVFWAELEAIFKWKEQNSVQKDLYVS
jgi:hypothetical protein